MSTKVAALVGGVVIVCFLGFGVYQAHSHSAYAESEIRATTRAVAQNIGASVVDDILTERWDNIEQLLLRLSVIGNISALTVADAQGKVIARVVRKPSTAPHVDYASGPRIVGPLSGTQAVRGNDYTYRLPIERGSRIGVVEVSANLGSLAAIRRQAYIDTLLAAWTAMTAGLLMLGLALRSTLRDMERTAGFAVALPGMHGAQLDVKSDVIEVRQLAQALSDVSIELKSQHDALQRTVQELEYEKSALDEHAIVSITDASGAITYANRKFEEISGYTAVELLGKNHRVLRSGLHPPEFYGEMWDTISSGRVWHGEIANRAKSGEIYWVKSTIVPWLDGNGLPYQYVAIRTDISAAKATENALALARARELETGHQIQRTLLLGTAPQDLRGVRIATQSEPSQGIDGDFFAFHRYGDDCFELLVGDVMGKGVPAALIGAAVCNTYSQVLAELLAVASGAVRQPEPQEIVNGLHLKLTPRLIALESFVTLALYRFELAANALTVVNAGHMPALLARGGEVEPLPGGNLPIGVIAEEVYAQQRVALGAGDALLAYSDGITEARSAHNEEYGAERLRALLRSTQALALPPAFALQALRLNLRDFVGVQPPTDDRTAVLIARVPVRAEANREGEDEFELDWDLQALGELRARIATAAAVLPDTARHELVLAAYETATNIVRHAPPPFADSRILCRVARSTQAVSVELIYAGEPWVPPQVRSEPDFSGDTEGGFGLYIIERSVDAIEYASPARGICSVRMEKRLPEAEGRVHG